MPEQDRHGTANIDRSGYHETITVAYKTLLFRDWSREVLLSPAARATWTPPDLRPLVLPGDR